MTPAIDVLLDVRALLARPGGWIKDAEEGPREQGGSAYCIQGALEAVVGTMYPSSRATRRVQDVLGTQIPAFNDAPATTQEDVLQALDRAIAAERNGDPITVSLLGDPLFLESHMEVQLALRRLDQASDASSLLEAFDSSNPFPPAA
jgi:hypothetical protein